MSMVCYLEIVVTISLLTYSHATHDVFTDLSDEIKHIHSEKQSPVNPNLGSSVINISAMKKPCLLYRVEYGRNKTLDDTDEHTWVCELNEEDRVCHTTNIFIYIYASFHIFFHETYFWLVKIATYNSSIIMQVQGLNDKLLTLCNDSPIREKVNSVGSCVVSGQTLLYSPYAQLDKRSITFHPKYPPVITSTRSHAHGKRKLDATIGNRTVVVLRVIALDTVTTLTIAQLFDRVFNTSVLSLRSGYDACSYGQLNLKPTTHFLTTNGIVNITININATGNDALTIENAVRIAATNILGDLSSQFDHILMAFPLV